MHIYTSSIHACIYAHVNHTYIHIHRSTIHTHPHTLIIHTYIHVCVNYPNIRTVIHNTQDLWVREKARSVLLAEAVAGATSHIAFPSPSPCWALRARWDLHTQRVHTGEEPRSSTGCTPLDLILTLG